MVNSRFKRQILVGAIVVVWAGSAWALGTKDKKPSKQNSQKAAVQAFENQLQEKSPAETKKIDAVETPAAETLPALQTAASSELVRMAWDASSKNNKDKVFEITYACLERFGPQALEQQAQLQGFPERGKEKDYQALNDAATCIFIQGEALMNNGKTEDAQTQFQKVIDQYPSAQAWDPSRGSFWSVAEKSQASIDMLTGKAEAMEEQKRKLESSQRIDLKRHTPGTEEVVDYAKYGTFLNVGSKDYRYQLNDPEGLSSALGEGIYPNTGAVLKNPGYKQAQKEGRLEGTHWDFVRSEDLEAAFYKWATAPEPWGIKLFYLGQLFEKAKMYNEAINAYYAIVVHFPNAVGWTYWQTPWYPGQAAIAKIKHLIRQHPELDLKYEFGKIEVDNGFDNDISNDVIRTYPGVLKKKGWTDDLKEKFLHDKGAARVNPGKIKKTVGEGEVQLVQYENNHWQLLVKGEPYIIRGMTYHPTKVGQSPDKNTLVSWMTSDVNQNGTMDGPYDAWVDRNRNNEQDPDEPTVGDFQLMKDMGVNTIREYHQPDEFNKELLRAMYEQYGIRVIVGDFLGKYAIGSGASWYEGTDYENPEHRKNMLESVQKMVMDYKDEPFVLMWLLGNENNYGVANNADKKPEAYYQFVNEVAQWIKSVDKNHPVAICNGDTLFLDIFAKNAPDVDIYSANAYRGDYGFGSYWDQVFSASGKPAFISEYGCPAYARHLSVEEAEQAQADYHIGNWLDIEENSAGYAQGTGNSIGGVVFEWVDEWWKNYEPFFHDRKSDAIGPFPGGFYFEEWFGLHGQGSGKKSPFLRQPRKSYFTYKDLWNSSN